MSLLSYVEDVIQLRKINYEISKQYKLYSRNYANCLRHIENYFYNKVGQYENLSYFKSLMSKIAQPKNISMKRGKTTKENVEMLYESLLNLVCFNSIFEVGSRVRNSNDLEFFLGNLKKLSDGEIKPNYNEGKLENLLKSLEDKSSYYKVERRDQFSAELEIESDYYSGKVKVRYAPFLDKTKKSEILNIYFVEETAQKVKIEKNNVIIYIGKGGKLRTSKENKKILGLILGDKINTAQSEIVKSPNPQFDIESYFTS